MDVRVFARDPQGTALVFYSQGAAMVAGMDVLSQAGAELLREKIQDNASGRPGPNIITGQYVGSWRTERRGFGEWGVYTDAVQAERLEYGFQGADSLGRVFDQPPFPHVSPAVAVMEPQFVGMANRLVAEVLVSNKVAGALGGFFRRR